MIKQATLFLLFLAYTSSVMAMVELCNFSFLENSQEDPSTLFISYLDFLNEENALDIDEFEEVLVRLESGTLINPFEAKEVSKENKAYGEIFQDYINVGIDEEKIKTYLKSIVKRERQTAQETSKTKKEVKDAFLPIEFGVITPGSSEREFEIDYSLEVMTTPVTYAHWNSVFKKPLLAEESGFFDYPKTNVNFYSQAFFADKFSVIKRYSPAYSFDDTSLENLGAYEGFLDKGKKGWKLQVERDFTEEEGYRLPTVNEQKLLLKRGIEYLGSNFDNLIDDYAYLNHNSNRSIHHTGSKEPFQIEGRLFYDIIGNVSESALMPINQSGKDRAYFFYETNGSSLRSKQNFKNEQQTLLIYTRGSFKGLRLVRTLKK